MSSVSRSSISMGRSDVVVVVVSGVGDDEDDCDVDVGTLAR